LTSKPPAGKIATLLALALSTAAASAAVYSKDFDLPIPSPYDPQSQYQQGWMDDAIITINDDAIIHDLNLSIDLTHDNLIDLQLALQSPAGTTVLLSTWGNPRLLDFTGRRNLLFDDQAQLSIEDAVYGFDGPYRGVEPLASFTGQNLSGQWTLRICDALAGDSGQLHSIELTFETPEPAAVLLLCAGAIILRLRRT